MVGVAIFVTLIPRIDHGKFSVQDVIDHTFARFTRGQIEAPLVKLVVSPLGADGEQQTLYVQAAVIALGHGVGGAHHDQFSLALVVDFFPCIGHMQHVAGIGFKPLNLVGCAVPRHDGKSRFPLGMKFETVTSRLQGLWVVDQRKIVKDAVVGGDGHVVRQARTGQLHWNERFELSLGI